MNVWLPTFWVSAALIVYGWLGYPALVSVLARTATRPVRRGEYLAPVTCVIAARDEEHVIGPKLDNLLSIDYPENLLDIVVVSDGSEDDTVSVVEERTRHAPDRVRLVVVPSPRGKAHALNVGVAAAHGEIVVFADARQRFDAQAIRALVRNFADPEVGAVSGELVLEPGRGQANAALASYWDFEKLIRKAESRSGSTIGCTGAIYAIRRNLFSPIPDGTILDDVLIPMRIVLSGRRAVFEEQALAFDRLSTSLATEFRRKVRTIAGNIQILRLCPALLNPLHGAVAWRFASHRLLPRVLMPYWLGTLFVSNLALHGIFYAVTLALQLFGYAAAILGLAIERRRPRLLGPASTLLMLNAAAVVAAAQYFSGLGGGLWRNGRRDAVEPQSSAR